MESGIVYVDGMDIQGVTEAGLKKIEVKYPGDTSDIEKNGGSIAGIIVTLSEFFIEMASEKLKKALDLAKNKSAYIVIETENVKNASLLEKLADECRECIRSSQVKIYIENGYTNENGRFYHNDYSDGPRLIQLVDKLNLLVAADSFGICINVGHANLLGINVRDMVRVCGKRPV